MMERKYQLVAWTENITDNENARLYMIPSFECEVQADLITDLTFIHQEEYKFHGPISLDLARRAVILRAYSGGTGPECLSEGGGSVEINGIKARARLQPVKQSEDLHRWASGIRRLSLCLHFSPA